MTGGIIQLVAYGIEDMFLTKDPQITFFKIVYRRHTNFSMEDIPHFFVQTPTWGKTVSCVVSKDGDLVSGATLVVDLPAIKNFVTSTGEDTLTKFAWVRRIGFVLIKSIEIEINGRSIDKHYGEWLNLWTEIFGRKDRGTLEMIGDTNDLTSFTNGKISQTLYIPLKFWFCRSTGLALPIVCLQYSDIKINLELNDFNKCYLIAPTHFIHCDADVTCFRQYEYIQQNIGNQTIGGIFCYFDSITKYLYYMQVTTQKFSGPTQSITSTALSNNVDPLTLDYIIYGTRTNFFVPPSASALSQSHTTPQIKNVQLQNAYLLITYIFLDEDERLQFSKSKHDYLIEQLFLTPSFPLDSPNRSVKLSINHPCKYLVWVVQLNYIYNAGDTFNYTNSYRRRNGTPIGNTLITKQTILFNGNERLSLRGEDYFSNVQHFQNSNYSPETGTNAYYFCLYGDANQPSGTCNTSHIETIQIQLQLSNIISIQNQAKCRAYGNCQNILRISNGLAAMVFI